MSVSTLSFVVFRSGGLQKQSPKPVWDLWGMRPQTVSQTSFEALYPPENFPSGLRKPTRTHENQPHQAIMQFSNMYMCLISRIWEQYEKCGTSRGKVAQIGFEALPPQKTVPWACENLRKPTASSTNAAADKNNSMLLLWRSVVKHAT